MPSKPASETPQDSGLVPQGERWRFGDFELDEPRRELRRHGELIEVEKKPLNLLMVFLRHPGQLLTKNDLLEAVWPGRIVVEAVLGNAVAKLRDALGDAGAVWLKTVFGFGYRFDAPVERITDDNGAVAPPRLSFNVGDVPPGRPNWQLVSRLGLSGDSWLAEHVKTKARRVFKFTSEPLGLSALKREVTVFRLLRESVGEKACYVDVLDWNFDEPPWFIEAEYCPGGSLQEWFNQQGGIRNVPLEVRLDLIAQIAEALAEIHIVGILHKDLKPANVFVVINADGKPTIRLGDFGSSRLVDATRIAALEITRMGFTQVIDAGSDTSTGTPLYFAPEVLAGQPVTVKADIYALGVMLYQFVVGNLRRQLGAGWEVEVDDEMLREDIALAAESNPERRLADAAELARNLRRIESRRVERAAQREAQARAERAARAMERLKARRVGLMAAFAALVIGFAVSADLYVEASAARTVAEKAAITADAETKRVRKVLDFLTNDMFKAVNTDDHPVKDLTVKDLLDAAVAAIPQRFNDDSELAARAYEAIGRSYLSVEQEIAAGNAFELALHNLRKSSEPRYPDLVRISTKLVGLQYLAGKLPATISEYESIYKDAVGLAMVPERSLLELQSALARAHVQMGEFRKGFEELIRIREQMSADPDRDNAAFVDIRRGLAYVSLEIGNLKIAEAVLNELYDETVKLKGERHRDIARIQIMRARVNYETERFDEAKATLDHAAAIAKEWEKPNGGLDLNVRLYRAWLFYYQHEYREAIKILIALKEDVKSADGDSLDQSYTEDRPLGLSFAAVGMTAEAIKSLQQGYKSARSALGKDHPWTLRLQRDLEELRRDDGTATNQTTLNRNYH